MIWLSVGSSVWMDGLVANGWPLQQMSDRACLHVKKLAGEIGARGSCTINEHLAIEYVATVFQEIGFTEVEFQEFEASPSAYARYALAFGFALFSQLLAVVIQQTWAYMFAAGAHALAAIAMYAESDFHWNWTHWIIRPRQSRNVLASCPASNAPVRTAVIMAHIDSHRTPFFNSTAGWQRAYNHSFRLLFLTLLLGAGLASYLAFDDAPMLKSLFTLPGIPLLLGLLAFLLADRSPYSPGAYDNASGVACMLAVAEILSRRPLEKTAIHFVATGCEETGAGGMQALIQQKIDTWYEALWINLDQTGIGELYLRLKEGMLRRYPIHPEALSLAREASMVSGIALRERESQAFSDAIVAHQKGLKAISLGASPTDPSRPPPRHQLIDVPEHIQQQTMLDTLNYTRTLLKLWDEQEIAQ